MAGLSDLLGPILGGGGSGPDPTKLLQPVLNMIQNNGGLQNVVGQLQSSPIGGQVSSWLGPGPNEPVSGDAIGEAIGEQNVEAVAQESGMSADEVKGGLSQLLPNLVDKLSPSGKVPGADQVSELVKQVPGGQQVQDQLSSVLGGLLGGRS